MRISDWSSDVCSSDLVPPAGSVLASPVFADWDPEPDYFFHWVRDSAIVMRSVAELMQDSASAAERRRWRWHFEDFVRFSLALCSLDGAGFASASRHRAATRRDFRRFLRSDSELRGLAGDRSDEHTSELQSLMRISYAVFCLT